jgi:protoporphyrinogen oxidase
MTNTQCIIIGAGVSGLSTAKQLQSKGIDCIVLEKASKPGGLIKCDVVNGHLFHRVGGHVFNTRVENVSKWFWEQFDKNNEFLSAKRMAGIYIFEKFLGYPFENNLYQLDPMLTTTIINEILDLEKTANQTVPNNFEDFLKSNFGTTLYNVYFKPYNQKIWKTDLSKVSLPWLEGKLPMPNYRDIVMSNILRREESNMVHSHFFYPKQNGSQFIADRLAQGLNIAYDQPANRIERIKDKWVVNGAFSADWLVYTGDIRRLSLLMEGIPNHLQSQMHTLRGLNSNGTSNLLCETDDTPHSWLYLPEANTEAHRIIYTGNFSPNNQPAEGRKSCTVEFSGETTLADMKKALGNLPGNLQAIDYNYEPNSYVIQQHGDRERINQLKTDLAPLKMVLCGRFAEWEYHNMDKAIESAMGITANITALV